MMATSELTLDQVMPQPPPPRGLPGEQPGGRAATATLDLLARARTGDADALNDLCARYLPRLQRWAHGRLPAGARGVMDTHDLVQETLTHVVRRLPSFEPRHEGAFQGYVRQALLNRIRDEARKIQRKAPAEPLPTDRPGEDPSPLEEAIGSEALASYEAAMARLRDDERQAIIGRIELGLPYAELAPMLGKPTVAAAHMAVSRALVRLAQEMSRGQAR
jgi:RNA polymerase sigma factor (sigma-70 family)